jgi:predicted nicotinamide N-methyase
MCIAQHLLVPELRMSLLNIVGSGNAALKNGITTKQQQQQQFVGVWPPTICIEFGAGAALPSLVLMKEGASRVVITDRYVNECTFDALRQSVIVTNTTTSNEGDRLNEEYTPLEQQRAVVVAHTWGENIDELLSHIGGSGVHDNNNNNDKDVNITATTGVSSSSSSSNTIIKANLLIASDCIYNPTYHHALLHSVIGTMDIHTGRFLVGYSLHGNVPSKQTLDFFTVAQREYGLIIVNELCINYPNGQLGIGSTDIERGVVYIKVLAYGDDG